MQAKCVVVFEFNNKVTRVRLIIYTLIINRRVLLIKIFLLINLLFKRECDLAMIESRAYVLETTLEFPVNE